MRKSPILTVLFPGGRQAILTATLMHPERWWYLSDLARHLGLRPSSLQRDLARLTDAGILRRRVEGNRVYFRADEASPVYPELRGLVLKTSGLVEVLRSILEPHGRGIRVAFVFGSIAGGREGSRSDVDLSVIGDVTLAGLAPGIRNAEDQLGRTVGLIHYAPAEFSSQALRSHFLEDILSKPKLFIIGDEHELEEIARGGAGRAAQVLQERAGRVARRGRAKPEGRSTRRIVR